MRREAPDPRFYAEIGDLNLGFLRLVAQGRRGSSPVLGLDSGVVEQLVRLTASQLEAVAATPCLLAGIAPYERTTVPASGVAEPRHDSDDGWLEATRLFAAGLITYVWQTVRRDSLLGGLCVGRAPGWTENIATLSFRELSRYAGSADHHLEARFLRHERFWPDLIRAVREGNVQRLRLTQLTGIQLALINGTMPASSPPVDAPSLRVNTGASRSRSASLR